MTSCQLERGSSQLLSWIEAEVSGRKETQGCPNLVGTIILFLCLFGQGLEGGQRLASWVLGIAWTDTIRG